MAGYFPLFTFWTLGNWGSWGWPKLFWDALYGFFLTERLGENFPYSWAQLYGGPEDLEGLGFRTEESGGARVLHGSR